SDEPTSNLLHLLHHLSKNDLTLLFQRVEHWSSHKHLALAKLPIAASEEFGVDQCLGEVLNVSSLGLISNDRTVSNGELLKVLAHWITGLTDATDFQD